ncbi:MAG TPA: LytTR family DNA-binding domain-containing protein [Bacteroidales bacterium]|nr:LytTR family DNA-binding domain-containing protein [Bacteroidales bacterium]
MEDRKTRCLIIDDEPLAIKLIKSHISKLDCFEIAGECRNALRAIEILRVEKIDLIFLDINMPEITGIEFLRTIPDRPYVIITTAYREYAIDGYDLDVVDFLLKPVSFERFLKAINRFFNRTRPAIPPNEDSLPVQNSRSFFHIQDGKNTVKLQYDDVIYFEGYGEYVKVITSAKVYIVRESLSDFETKLSGSSFLRIHKSYIVNVQKIKGFSSIHVLLKDKELPIGRMYREKAINALKNS